MPRSKSIPQKKNKFVDLTAEDDSDSSLSSSPLPSPSRSPSPDSGGKRKRQRTGSPVLPPSSKEKGSATPGTVVRGDSSGPRGKLAAYVFTINNPAKKDGLPTPPYPSEEEIESGVVPPFRFLIYQLEEGENKVPHYQGYILLSTAAGWDSIRSYGGDWSRAHFARALSTPQKNYNYCTKPEGRLAGPWQIPHGAPIPVLRPGKRTDWDDFREACTSGASDRELATRFTRIWVTAHAGAEKTAALLRPGVPDYVLQSLRPWQAELLKLLEEKPNDRDVLWVYDELGGGGKTRFAKHLSQSKKVLLIGPAKGDRLCASFKGEDIVFIDIPRSYDVLDGRSMFSAIEAIKDGKGNSQAFYGAAPTLHASPHVVIYANYAPDTSLLSLDRWKIFKIVSPAYTWVKE